jgi:predicted metal-binding protein
MVTIFVCITCRQLTEDFEQDQPRPGAVLANALEARLAAEAEPCAVVRRVDCLAVCERPCTIALAAEDKWTYLIGDVDPLAHADDVVGAARKVSAAPNGIVRLRERPPFFRKGVIARVPPLSFEGEIA